MTPEFYQRVREVYLAACEADESARGKLLQSLCAGDVSLLTEVQSLLTHHDANADALADSRLQDSAKGLYERLFADSSTENTSMAPGFAETIGRYRLVRRLGEGGMGVVFEAEQDHPRRRVALKLVRLGFSSERLLQRFQHEGEMLGRLRHPGIAHIYESGVFEAASGARFPFLAMELIEGITVTEFSQARRLGTRDRLSLMAKVCDAVEHAHQNGVVHRDLKPGNILVDATGQPKVLDFGIARATDLDVRMTTLQTTTGQLIGTLPYMSPEQASGDPRALDTRSDVYSLGVVLYELLSGRLPHELHKHSLADAVRLIQYTDPPRIATLNPGFRGDVDTILSKALEKEKTRRYSSAGEFAADMRRFLSDQPLVARPASAIYQLRKFARRNRGLVAAASLCFLLLIGGVTGTTAGWLSAIRASEQLAKSVAEVGTQRDRARESEARATTELARSQKVSDLLRAMLRSVDPSVARERDTSLLRELLEDAVAKLDRGELADQPVVEADMRATIARTFMGIGDNTAALRVIEPAIRLAQAAPPGQRRHYQAARLYYATALVVWRRYTEAWAEFEECLRIHETERLPEDELAASLYSNFAGQLADMNEPERALQLHERALEIRRRLLGERHPDVAASLGNMALSRKVLNQREEALALMEESLEIYRAAVPPRPLQLTILENNMADLLIEMDRPAEAEFLARDSLTIGSRIYKPNHQQQGMTTHTLGRALRAQGRHAEAREAFERSAEILAYAYDEHHPLVSIARIDWGTELISLGHYDDAECALLAAYDSLFQPSNRQSAVLSDCVNAALDLYEAWGREVSSSICEVALSP